MTSSNRPIYLALLIVSMFTGIEPKLAGVIVRPFDIILLCLILSDMMSGRFRFHESDNSATVLLLIGGIYKFFVAFILVDFFNAIKEFIQLIEYLIFFFIVISSLSSFRNREVFFKWLFRFSIVIAIVTAILHIRMGFITGYKEFDEARHAFGVSGFCGYYLYLRKKNTTNLILFLLAIVLLLMSGERKGWVACAIGAGYLNFFFTQKKFNVGKLILPGLVVITVYVVSTFLSEDKYYSKQGNSAGEITDLLVNINENIANKASLDFNNDFESRSDAARYFILLTGIEQFQKSPIVGIGPGNFRKAVTDTSPVSWIRNGAHNQYLNELVEYGIIGFILFMTTVVIIFLSIRRTKPGSNMLPLKQQKVMIMAIFLYGSIINAFDGGGDAINFLYVCLPAGLILSMTLEMKRMRMQQLRASKMSLATVEL